MLGLRIIIAKASDQQVLGRSKWPRPIWQEMGDRREAQ